MRVHERRGNVAGPLRGYPQGGDQQGDTGVPWYRPGDRRTPSEGGLPGRGDDFSCAKASADEARNNEDITVLTNTVVEKVEGDSVLRSITYRNTRTGEVSTFSPDGDTFGLFVFAGYTPSTDLIIGTAELDDKGYVVTDRQQKNCRCLFY